MHLSLTVELVKCLTGQRNTEIQIIYPTQLESLQSTQHTDNQMFKFLDEETWFQKAGYETGYKKEKYFLWRFNILCLYRLLKCVHFIWGFKYFQNDCGVRVVVWIMLLNILQIFFCDDRACHDVGGVVLTQLITADPTPVLRDQYQVSRDHQPGVPASQLSPTVSDCCCCWLPTFFSLSETISHHILTHLHSTSHHTYILIISNKHCLLFTIMYWYML